MPGIPELVDILGRNRDNSAADESLISSDGNQFRQDLPHKHAGNGLMNSCQFLPDYLPDPDSPSHEIAFALYAFHAQQYDRLSDIRLNWDGTATAQDWLLGLVNWQSGRWDILPGTEGGTLEFDSFDPYFSSEGNLLAAVLVLGTDSHSLSSIRLGQPGPLAAFTTTSLAGKVPLSVTFMGGQSSSPNGNIVNFTFDPEGGSPTDNGTNPDFVHNYTVPGWYKAHCEVTDESGLSSEQEFNVFAGDSANLSPVADFAATPLLGETPLPVAFDASISDDADGSIVTYLWDFQDDGIMDYQSSQPFAQHTYGGNGIFQAKLIVLDDKFGSGTASKTIAVVPNDNYGPVGQFSWLMDSAYAPASVTLSAAGSFDADGFIANYEWDLDNDGVFEVSGPDQMEVPVQFMLPGSYPVALRLTDDEGLQGNNSNDVLVLEGWQHTIGGLQADSFAQAISDGQGGVLACGKISTGSEPADVDMLLANFGPDGELFWVRSLDIGYVEEGTGLAINGQGTIMLVGRGVNSTFNTDYAIVTRWNLMGDLLSSKFTTTLTADVSATAVAAAGDDFIMSGQVEVEATGVVNTAFWRFDNDGNKLWSKQLSAPIDIRPAGLAVQYDAGDPAAALIYGLADLTPAGNGSLIVQLDINGNLLWKKDLLASLGPCHGSALLAEPDQLTLGGSVDSGNSRQSFVLVLDGSGSQLASEAFTLPDKFIPSGLGRSTQGELFLAANGTSNNPGGIGLARLSSQYKVNDYYVGKWPGKVTAHSFLSMDGSRLITGGQDEHTGSFWRVRASSPASLDFTLSDAGHPYTDLALAYLDITATVEDPAVVLDSGGGETDASLHVLRWW